MNKTAEGANQIRYCLKNLTEVLGFRIAIELSPLFAPPHGELASSDKAWNMLSLNRQTHDYWGRAYYGLKWIGVDPLTAPVYLPDSQGNPVKHVTAAFQLCWLDPRIHDSFQTHLERARDKGDATQFQRVRLETDEDVDSVIKYLEDLSKRSPALLSTKGATIRDQYGGLVESGRLFNVTIEEAHLDHMRCCVEWQWLAARMAAFSGAGEAPEQLDRNFPPPELGLYEPVETPSWEERLQG